MEETTIKNTAAFVATPVVDAAETTKAFGSFRRQQYQRQPLNLLQCMDKDGNIDAFRYIEYSQKRRMEFLQRADFICKMKSTLRMQHQQQILHRSSSLPGMTALPMVPIPSPIMANGVFKQDPRAGSVSPETTITGDRAFSDMPKSSGLGQGTNNNSNNNKKNNDCTRPVLPAMPAPVRFLSRSVSMPFVASSFGKNASINNINNANPGVMVTTHTVAQNSGIQNEEFQLVPQRRLRRDEFEAAEALLFGMGRGSKDKSHRPDSSTRNKRRDALSPKDQVKDTGTKDSTWKRRRISDPRQGEILSRSEEIGSVHSVVSQEDDTSASDKTVTNASRQEEIV